MYFFWTNIFLIFLEYVSFSLGNNFFGSSGRFGGLLGYDFVPFILATYIVNLISRNKSLSYFDMLTISISIVAILMSGRFGIVVLGLFTVLMALQNPRAAVWVPIMFVVPLVLLPFQTQLSFAFASLEMIATNLISGTADFSKLDEFKLEGYYNASPLTWAKEFLAFLALGIAFGFQAETLWQLTVVQLTSLLMVVFCWCFFITAQRCTSSGLIAGKSGPFLQFFF